MSNNRTCLKSSTDPGDTIKTNISTGGSEECWPGELVVGIESSPKLYAVDSDGAGVSFTGLLKNQNKGSFTVSSGGEGPTSFSLNSNAVTTSKILDNSITDSKLATTLAIAQGGTGQTDANSALNALLPSQTGNNNKLLQTNGSNASWTKFNYSIDEFTDVNTSSTAPLNDQRLKWTESTGNWTPNELISVPGDELITSDSTGRTGQSGLSSEYLYVCVAENQWKQTGLQSWTDGSLIRVPTSTGSVVTQEPVLNYPLPDSNYSNVSLLLPMNGANDSTTFTDIGNNNLTVTRYGNTIHKSTVSLFSSTSGYFDGLLDGGLSVPSTAAPSGSTDHTVECWVYPTSTATSIYLWSYRQTSTTGSGVALYYGTSAGRLYLFDYGWGGSWDTGIAVTINTWNHVAYVKAGSSLRKIFVNGIQGNSITSWYGGTTSVGTFQIGRNPNASAAEFTGYMSEFRITQNIARYSSNFTPPTTRFSNWS